MAEIRGVIAALAYNEIPLDRLEAARARVAELQDLLEGPRRSRWYDGDPLVIDTIDFAPGYISTMGERAGLPQSRRMRTVERISRAEDALTIETTHQDPTYYRKPIVVSIPYSLSDYELLEYGCTPEEASIVSPN